MIVLSENTVSINLVEKLYYDSQLFMHFLALVTCNATFNTYTNCTSTVLF